MFEYITDILAFDADRFHFLRPAFLWAFIPVFLVALIIVFTHREDRKWKKVIAPALQPYMFTREKRSGFLYPLLAYLLIMSMGVLGLSGPTWSKVDVPGARSEAVLLVAMDVSTSMLAEDIQPNRLERARFKVRDLLDANPGARVGLAAYAGTAHTVIPMSSDYRIVRHQLEALSPAIMPLQGTRLPMMLALADSILSPVKAPSTLLIISDEIRESDLEHLRQFVLGSPHSIEFLALSTPQGAQIPTNARKEPLTDAAGNVVISKLNTELLYRLQEEERISVNTLTLDDSDMQLIADKVRKNLDYQEDAKESRENWKDMGFILLLLVVALMPFWFRRGWMIQYLLVPGLFLLTACSGVESWKDLWYTKDYQGQMLSEAGHYEEAGNTFESDFQRGTAYYKAGNYDAAAQAFARDSSTASLYNRGMALSQLGRYEEALEVIRLASSKEPGNKRFEAALDRTEQTLGVIDSLKAAGAPVVLPEKEEEKKEKLEERRASGKDEELSSDTEVDELPDDGKRVTDEVETEMRKAKELDEVPDDLQPGGGENPQNILLRGISEDPSEFLRRRFRYQYEKYHMDRVERGDPW